MNTKSENNTENNYDFWNHIFEKEKINIDKGLADIKAGRVKSHEEVLKTLKKWLR